MGYKSVRPMRKTQAPHIMLVNSLSRVQEPKPRFYIAILEPPSSRKLVAWLPRGRSKFSLALTLL